MKCALILVLLLIACEKHDYCWLQTGFDYLVTGYVTKIDTNIVSTYYQNLDTTIVDTIIKEYTLLIDTLTGVTAETICNPDSFPLKSHYYDSCGIYHEVEYKYTEL